MGVRTTVMRGQAATVASVVFLHSSSGLAQDDAGQEPVDVVVRGSSKESLGFRRTRAITDLNKDDLSETPATSVPDALRRAPGVAIQQTTPGQGTVYVRGMSSREVLVLVDGVRLNGSLFRAGNNPYLGLVDPYSVREALVLRGTSSVEHGSDALGGVIDLRTSLPGYSLADGGTTRVLSLQHLWTNGPGSASRVAAEHACGNWAGQVGFTSIAQGDIRPGEGENTPVPSSYWGLDRTPGEPYTPDSSATQHGTGFRSYFGDMALRRRVGQGSEVVVRAQVGYRPELLRFDQVTPRFKREYPAQAESAAAMSRTMLSLEWAKRWSDKPIDELRVTVSWQQLAEATVRRDLDESCAPDPLMAAEDCTTRLVLTPAETRKREKNRSDALSVSAITRSKTTSGTASVLAGLDGVHDRVSSRAWKVNAATLEDEAVPERYPDGSSQTHLGAFVRGELEFLPSMRGYVGVRGGLFRLDIHSRTETGGAESPSMEQTMTDLAASAGVRWDISHGVAWMSNAGRGIRAANVQDLSTLGPRAGGRYQVPNDTLTPEHSLSLDTGIKLERMGVRAETFLFYIRHEDAILLAPTTVDGQAQTSAGDRYYASFNAASVTQFGIESAWRVSLSPRIGVFAVGLAVLGNQRNPNELDLPEKTPADRIPPPQGTVGLWAEALDDVHVEVFASGAASQDRLNIPTNVDDNRIPEEGTPGYVTFHGRLAWTASRQLTARLALDNVTDQLVLEHGSGYYAPGFNAMLGVDFVLE